MPSYNNIILLAAVFALAATQTIIPDDSAHTISSVLLTVNHSFSQSDQRWQQHIDNLRAVKIEPGCGRMQNRLVTFEDGSKACARYRLNAHLMQGEIYSHIIAKLLKISNLAPLATTLPDIQDKQWSRVEAPILEANWQSKKLLILTKFIPDTKEVVLPQQLRSMQAGSISPKDITADNADLLAQWSDLIVFDYIVGNMDRIVNSLHNKQWNNNIMDMSVHNLAEKDNSLIFFDNEDGLFHGYRILDRYSEYHEQSLEAICVFRKSTADAITSLLNVDSIKTIIDEEAERIDSRILKYLPKISSKTIKVLQQRMLNVSEHIKRCSQKYN